MTVTAPHVETSARPIAWRLERLMMRARPAFLIRTGIVVGLIALAELLTRLEVIPPSTLTPPSDMVRTLIALLADGSLLPHIWATVGSVLIASILAVTVGTSAALVIHRLPGFRATLEPLFGSYYALPFFAFYPLWVVLLGLNGRPIIVMGALLAVVSVVTTILAALNRMSRALVKAGRLLAGGPFRLAFLVTLPALFPAFFTAIRLAVAYAFIGVIASEFLLSTQGLGYQVAYTYSNFENEQMYAIMLLIIIFVLGINGGLQALERRVSGGSASGIAAEAPRRTGRRAWLHGVILVVALLVLWQLLHGMVGGLGLASPMETGVRLVSLLGRADFHADIAQTGEALLWAYAISLGAGVMLGLACGLSRLAAEVVEPLAMAFYSLPKVTLYPLVLLVFGLDLSAKVAFGVIHGVVPILVFTLNGVRQQRPAFARAGRTMGMSAPAIARYIMLPAALPEITAGARIGFSVTLMGVLVGEMFASQAGLGFRLFSAISANDLTTILAITMLLGGVAVAVNILMMRGERLVREGRRPRTKE